MKSQRNSLDASRTRQGWEGQHSQGVGNRILQGYTTVK